LIGWLVSQSNGKQFICVVLSLQHEYICSQRAVPKMNAHKGQRYKQITMEYTCPLPFS